MSFGHAVTLVTVNLIISLLGSIGNVSVCATILCTRSLQTTSSYCVVNLAIADLTVTLLVQPMVAGIILGKIQGTCLVKLEYAARLIGSLSCAISIITLTLMSIERCLAITKPLKYKGLVNPRKLKISLCFVWLLSFTFPCMDALASDRRVYPLFAAGVLLSMYVVIVLCYCLIFQTVRKQSRLRAELQIHQNASSDSDKRLSKTVALVIGIFTLFWAPFVLYVIVKPEHNFGSVYVWIVTLGLSNSGINHFIYFFRSGVFRKSLRDIIAACFFNRNAVRPFTDRHVLAVSNARVQKEQASLQIPPDIKENAV